MTGRPLPGGTPDDGTADPRLAAALAAHDGSPAARAEVLAALATARVFLAVRATSTGRGTAVATGLPQESGAEMALVCLRAPSGATAVPAFADGHAVQRWRPDARPVPLPGPQACAAAREQGASALVLDPGGAAVATTASELAALADGRVPVPGSALSSKVERAALRAPQRPVDPELVAGLSRVLRSEPLRAARLLEGPDGLVLGVAGDLGPADLAALAARVVERAGAVLPVGGLDLTLVAPDGPGVPVPLRRRLPGLGRALRGR